MRTIDGLAPVDVIYRRIDDLFLDPEVFRADSTLGVRGLLRAWTGGQGRPWPMRPGPGVADDKVVYAYVPEMIRYYLGEEPIIPNVPTYLCIDAESAAYVLAHLEQTGGEARQRIGRLRHAGRARLHQDGARGFAEAIQADPRNYIAQPTLKLSTVPTSSVGELEPRHVDLRPFILSAERHR